MCVSIAGLCWRDYVGGSGSGCGGLLVMSLWLGEGGTGVVET